MIPPGISRRYSEEHNNIFWEGYMSSHLHKTVRFTVIGILLVSIGVFAAAQEKKNATAPTNTSSNQVLTASKQLNPKLPPAKAKGGCHVNGELPDPKCTPGVADSA